MCFVESRENSCSFVTRAAIVGKHEYPPAPSQAIPHYGRMRFESSPELDADYNVVQKHNQAIHPCKATGLGISKQSIISSFSLWIGIKARI